MGLLFNGIRAIKSSSLLPRDLNQSQLWEFLTLSLTSLALKEKEKELKAHCNVVRSFISWIRRNIKVGQRIPERLFKMGKQRS
ncbi:hypothetical protein NC651_007969 [Populus alba x Populus x berolinensis]|nr:hypothetical protein NC651_007969 [Populus alba x Populus x berolinensis]